jgi:hypothetical protein
LMHVLPVADNLIGERSELPLLLTPRTFESGLVAFKTPDAYGGNHESTNDQDDPPVECDPREASRERICHGGITSWDLTGTEYTPDCQGAKITEVAWSRPERREMSASVRTVEVSRCLD